MLSLQNLAVLAWFALLLLAAYAPVLRHLAGDWINDSDMGHGIFVPCVAAYIAWQKRAELAAAPRRANWLGLVVVAYAALQLTVATLGAELFLARTAFVLSVVGTVLLLGGTRWLGVLSFPLFLLFFMVPIPAIIYNQITFPLQILASRVAENALSLMGIPVLREGNVLELSSQRLSVVEACSGIRSLLSLSFLALVYAYFFDSKPWMRAVLLAAALPIAIATNAFRVTLTGVLSEWNKELADGFFHAAEGWVIFLLALAIMVATHAALRFAYSRWKGEPEGKP